MPVLGELHPTSATYVGMHQLVTPGVHLFVPETAAFFVQPGLAEAGRKFPRPRVPPLPAAPPLVVPPPLVPPPQLPAPLPPAVLPMLMAPPQLPPQPVVMVPRRMLIAQERHPKVPLFSFEEAKQETFDVVLP